jgi:diguanylate cyclase (GGDEF)-like protein
VNSGRTAESGLAWSLCAQNKEQRKAAAMAQPSQGREGERRLAAQVEDSYRHLPTALIVNVVNSAILGAVLWPAIDPRRILVWLVGMLLLTVGRFAIARAYREQSLPSHADNRRWARYFLTTTCASGLMWGLAGVALFHPESLPHQVFLCFMIGGMVAGALPLQSALAGAFACFLIPALLPISVKMLLQGDQIHVTMGLMGLVFGAAMLSSSLRIHRMLRESIELRVKLSDSIADGQRLQQIANVDALTGIANRRLFDDALAREWRRATRNRNPASLVLADIDYFKAYNDMYGHQAGDDCLRLVAQSAAKAVRRPADLVARIGGEEFAVLLPETSTEGAHHVAELIRRAINALNIAHDNSPVARHITVSLGTATLVPGRGSNSSALFEAADRALYVAKRRGRNRVASHAPANGTSA